MANKKHYIENGAEVFATGVYLIRDKNGWKVYRFEDDTYYDGQIVKGVETKPYVED